MNKKRLAGCFVFCLIMLTMSCRCRKQEVTDGRTVVVDTPVHADPDPATDEGARKRILQQNTHRLVVSFISIGEGTMPEAKGMLDNYISAFENRNKVHVVYAVKHWGREGESDQLFSLEGLTAAQQQDFVNGLRELFKDNQLILIEENRADRMNQK
jgi:hypothetical protein